MWLCLFECMPPKNNSVGKYTDTTSETSSTLVTTSGLSIDLKAKSTGKLQRVLLHSKFILRYPQSNTLFHSINMFVSVL